MSMRITRVYTRTGDKGQTGLVDGTRVDKDHARIEATGTVDELNAVLGLARTFNSRSGAEPAAVARLEAMLRKVQNELFDVGAELSTPDPGRFASIKRIGEAEITRLEAWCDELNADLGPLTEFVLPGGGPVNGFLHQARTVCRRAERRLVTLQHGDAGLGPEPLKYLNRLSDWLFVASRWAAKQLGEPEYLWER